MRRSTAAFAALVLVLLVAAAVLPARALATDYFVSTLGADTVGAGTADNPFLTIQYAMSVATSGDTVNVAAGAYGGPITLTSGVALVGAGKTQTAIGGGDPILFADGVDDGTKLEGLRVDGDYFHVDLLAVNGCDLEIEDCAIVRGGRMDAGGGAGIGITGVGGELDITGSDFTVNYASNGYGAGIYAVDTTVTIDSSSFQSNQSSFAGQIAVSRGALTMTNSTVHGGYAYYDAGGVYVGAAPVVLEGNTFTSNYSSSGGAVKLESCLATVTGNTFANNWCNYYGGALYCASSTATITGNTIKDNETRATGPGAGIAGRSCQALYIANNLITGNKGTQIGGGVFSEGSNARLVNNTLYGNSSNGTGGSAIAMWGVGQMDVTNCITWNNPGDDLLNCSATYSNVETQTPDATNISVDPSFVSTSTGDFRLAADSPCIDVATQTAAPAFDIAGFPRPLGLGVDMGAYEYLAPCTVVATAGAHGTISPAGTQTVGYGEDATFTVKPSTGYHVDGVEIDGVSVGASSTVVLHDVVADHSVVASFSANPVKATSLKVSGNNSVKRSYTYKLSGSITPSAAPGKVKVVWRRWYSGSYHTAKTQYWTLKNGKVAPYYKPTKRGTWRVYVSYPRTYTATTTYAAAKTVSKKFYVK